VRYINTLTFTFYLLDTAPELDELKQQSIDATEIWKIAGNHRSGTVNSNRIKIKLSYQNAIKEATSNADSNFNDL